MKSLERFDIFIPAAPKDYLKLPYLIASIRENIKGFGAIHLCVPSPLEVPEVVRALFHHVHADKDVLPIDKGIFRYRPTWIYQQFLKLFQDVTSDLYLTVDSDVVFIRPMPLFISPPMLSPGEALEAARRVWWYGWDQNHEPYYKFNRCMLGLERELNHTCLCDMNFFDRKIIREMVVYALADSHHTFIQRAAQIIDESCHPSEADLYGQFVHRFHRGMYEFRQANTMAHGRHIQSFEEQAWPDIETKIEEAKQRGVDMAMLHSWYSK